MQCKLHNALRKRSGTEVSTLLKYSKTAAGEKITDLMRDSEKKLLHTLKGHSV